MLLDTVVGHLPLITQLRQAAEDQSLGHALLLTGPEGTGKTLIARGLAELLLEAQSWPGGIDAHPDLWMEDGTAERIRIDRVRAGGRTDDGTSLQDFLVLRPYAGGRRVAVMARADRLTEDAANSLLKTVEEPPAGTHLILTTANPDRLPATILSRCQQLTTAPVSGATIAGWLQSEHGVAAPLAELAAGLAAGRPGRARHLALDAGGLETEVRWLEGFLGVAGTGIDGALRGAGELAPAAGAEGREAALVQLAVWSSFVRDAACYAAGVPDLALWGDWRPALEAWAQLGADRLSSLLGSCMSAAEDIAGYAQPRLTYEVLFLDIFAHPQAPSRVAEPRLQPIPAGPPAAGRKR